MTFRVCAFSDRETTISSTKLLSRAAQHARDAAEANDHRYVVLDEAGRVVFCAVPGHVESIRAWENRQATPMVSVPLAEWYDAVEIAQSLADVQSAKSLRTIQTKASDLLARIERRESK